MKPRNAAVFWAVLSIAVGIAPAAAAGPDAEPVSLHWTRGRLPAAIADAVVFAEESVVLGPDSSVLAGDVIVNRAGTGRTAAGPAELVLSPGALVAERSSLRAHRVALGEGAGVAGAIHANRLIGAGDVAGPVRPLALPVSLELAPFRRARIPAGAPEVEVPTGGSIVLAPGAYDRVRVRRGGELRLAGGLYRFGSLRTGAGAALLFEAPAEVRVARRTVLGRGTAVASARDAGERLPVVIHVAGGDEGGHALAVTVGPHATIDAAVYAPFGTVSLGAGTAARGTFVARHVRVGRGAVLTLPVTAEEREDADPEEPSDVPDQDEPPSDGDPPPSQEPPPEPPIPPDPPDQDDPPGEPPPPEDPPAEDPPADDPPDRDDPPGEEPPPAPEPPGDGPPPDQDEPPASPGTVTAFDLAEGTFQDVPVTVTLLGTAPEGVGLTFEVVVPATDGILEPLVPGDEVPCRSATVRYRPDAGFTGADGFAFQACATVSGRRECDDAVVVVEVLERSCEVDPSFCDDGR